MTMIRFIVFAIGLITSICALGQPDTLAWIKVDAGDHNRSNLAVHAPLKPINITPDELRLVTRAGEGMQEIDIQLESGSVNRRFWWILEDLPAGREREYLLLRKKPEETTAPYVQVVNNDIGIKIKVKERPVLQYYSAVHPAPEGTDPLYARSGFIHPLWSPDGAVLTHIRPDDHYHHVGIWNPWTKTEVLGKDVDFWNLAKGQGTVRFAGYLSKIKGDVFGGYRSLHKHVVLNEDSETTALKEIWDVRAWNTEDISIIDFTSILNCANDVSLVIKEYRYQGFCIRAAAKWNEETAEVLTSAGKDQSNGNATRAEWVKVTGISNSKEGTSGVLFINHPGNFNYPEHLRIWPLGSNGGEENIFINFNPAQDREWVLEPGREYVLRYRIITYDGDITPEEAENYARGFNDPPNVNVEYRY